MAEETKPATTTYPNATRRSVIYDIGGKPGDWERLTRAQAKEDPRECLEAIYDGRALGVFALIGGPAK